jgi:uncharacterized protein (TIGR00369 family)
VNPITDPTRLLLRMRELFPREMVPPGVDLEIMEVDFETGATTLRFDVSGAWANQFGALQGGVVATMLDGCIGIAGAARSGGMLAMPLAEINVSFIRPVPAGAVIGKGIATRLGRKAGFIEGTLLDLDGQVLARGSGIAIPTPFPDAFDTS